MMLSSLFFFFFPLLIPVIAQENRFLQVAGSCRNADNDLIANPDVNQKLSDMLDAWLDQCLRKDQCPTEPRPIQTSLSQDWNVLEIATILLMNSACEFFTTREVCDVTTTTRFTNLVEIDGLTIITDVIEKNRPLCYPRECTDDEVTIVHPEPADCNAGDSNCEVLSYTLGCPGRQTSSGTCGDSVISSSHLFNTLQSVFKGILDLTCAAALESGDNSDSCALYIDEVNVDAVQIFDGFKNDNTYKNYEQSCYDANSKFCLVTLNAEYPIGLEAFDIDIPYKDLGDIRMHGESRNIPICLPDGCSDAELNVLAVEHYVRGLRENFDAKCGQSSIPCTAEVENIVCYTKSDAPSSSPSNSISSTPTSAITFAPSDSNKPSSFPTPSAFTAQPTTSSQPSSKPSIVPSDLPTIVTSEFPSSIPSVFPTDSPSDSPSLFPSLVPSISHSPSIVASSEPTGSPTPPVTSGPTICRIGALAKLFQRALNL